MYVIKGFLKDLVLYYVKTSIDENLDIPVNHYSHFINDAMMFDDFEEAEKIIYSLEFKIFKVYPVCPSCNKDYEGYPALSRKDNKTLICSSCGTLEALNQFLQIQES